MHNNEYQRNYIDTNECTSRGVCSIAPNIAALQEVILYHLKHIAHYILKLEKLGANNTSIKQDIINDIATLVSSNEFSEKQLYNILLKEYYILQNTKQAYKKVCSDLKYPYKELKNVINFDSKTTIPKATALGEKLFLQKCNKITTREKNLTEILLILLKSTCINLTKINDFHETNEKITHEVLVTLDLLLKSKIQINELKDKIVYFAKADNKLQLQISQLLLTNFGGISETKVSHSTQKGKAILVSGNNFFDLLKILEATKNKEIDVYTHSNLLITHALKKFSTYKNLKGHYGGLEESEILDFATFPGSILLTKNSKSNSEYLYRGRLFSTDYIVPQGVIKIENDDFTKLIETAENAKGFSKGKIKEDTILGYNETSIANTITKIGEKLNSKELKRLYIIGQNPHSEIQKEYFKEIFSNIKKDEFVISFSYESKNENVLTINIGDYTPLATNIIDQILQKISLDNIIFFFTTCDVMSISNLILLNSLKAKNLYINACSPIQINPSVFETLKKEYNINEITTPTKDLDKIRQK